MPELPDAVVYRRILDRTSLGQPIAGTAALDEYIMQEGPSPDVFNDTLVGRTLTETHRHGKHVFARYAENGWIALHFGMTGRLRYYDGDDHPEYAYVRLRFENGAHLAFVCPRKLGRVRFVDSPDAFVQHKELGPDAYRADFDTVRERLAGRRGTIKGALLNQKILAGLGNIYADEVLYQIGVHPRTTVKALSEERLRALYDAMHTVLDAAIDAEADPTALDPERFMLPHRYDDERCPATGVPLETEQVSGRTAYFSPERQGLVEAG
jgi:formamidopyrimidine-DNA glycosylase